MKKFIKITMIMLLTLSLTSCYQFNREQKLKNAENNGKAILVEAEGSKKALIEAAKAEKESASLIGDADVIRAEAWAKSEIAKASGVAKANEIIGQSLKGNREYLEYLKIQAVQLNQGDKLVYIPTEAMLPITEARK